VQVFSEPFSSCLFTMLFPAKYLKSLDQVILQKTKWFKWKLEKIEF